MSKRSIAILTTGLLPVPSVLGGAVENLTQNFIDENKRQGGAHLTVYSSFTPEAEQKAQQYEHTTFVFIKTPWIIRQLDIVFYTVLRLFIRSQRASSFRAIFQRLHFMCRISKCIAAESYDAILLENAIVQLHVLRWHGNAARYKGRVYVHVHNEIMNFFKTQKYLMDAHVITVSQFIKNSLITKLNESHDARMPRTITVLKNSVDDTKFTALPRQEASRILHEQYGIDEAKRIILFSGRLIPEKGIDVLIRALHHVSGTNYQFLVVGSSFFGTDITSPFLRGLRALAEPHMEHITFTGYIDYDKMPLLYRGCDFAVLPSVCNDAAPLTVIESITAGLPLITTRVGGIPEYAQGGAAIVLDVNDDLEHSIASSIDLLLRDDKKRQKMSEASQVVAQGMTLTAYYEGLLKELAEVTDADA